MILRTVLFQLSVLGDTTTQFPKNPPEFIAGVVVILAVTLYALIVIGRHIYRHFHKEISKSEVAKVAQFPDHCRPGDLRTIEVNKDDPSHIWVTSKGKTSKVLNHQGLTVSGKYRRLGNSWDPDMGYQRSEEKQAGHPPPPLPH